jgi:hypothetical protein
MNVAGRPLSNKPHLSRKGPPARRPIGRDRALRRMTISGVHLALSIDRDCEAALLFSLLGLTLSLVFAKFAPEGLALLGAY